MNQNTLGDYRNPEDGRKFGSDRPGIGGAMFQQEANTLKIEKLSHRVTIISVIIPCIIIAILVFVYMDITEKVVDVDQTQANQMAQVSQALEIKLNALDVRIAKATHKLDEKLTALEGKRKALETQTAKMSAAKVDLKAMEAALAKLDKRINSNAARDKSTLAAMESMKQQLSSAIDKNSSDAKAVSGQIKKEFSLFKEEFDARLLELSAYEQSMAKLVKDTNLLNKKLDGLKKEAAASLNKHVSLLRQDLENQIADVKKRADAANATAKKATATAKKATATAAAVKSTYQQATKKSTSRVQSTIKPQASPRPVPQKKTQTTQTPDTPVHKVPGTGGILEQDLSQ